MTRHNGIVAITGIQEKCNSGTILKRQAETNTLSGSEGLKLGLLGRNLALSTNAIRSVYLISEPSD